MIRTVIFDIGRVLVDFDHSIAVRNLAKICKTDAAHMQRLIYDSNLENKYQSGDATTEDIMQLLQTSFGVSIPEEQFVTAASDIFQPKLDSLQLLTDLLDERCQVQLLSNTSPAHWIFLSRTFPVLTRVTKKTLSFEVGAMKPSTKIYEHALQLANHPASQCFYTDDIPEYTAAAAKLGMQTYTFGEATTMRTKLTELGVL